jgi:hypothetical protein
MGFSYIFSTPVYKSLCLPVLRDSKVRSIVRCPRHASSHFLGYTMESAPVGDPEPKHNTPYQGLIDCVCSRRGYIPLTILSLGND